jgi:hypothetical protein
MKRDERNLEVPAHPRSTDDTASDKDSRDPRIAKRITIERFTLDVVPTDFSLVENAGSLVGSAANDPDTQKQQAAKKDKLSLLQDGTYIAEPGVFDVLLGRGKPIQENPGNRILRQIVDFHSRSYLCAARKDKKGIAQDIVLAMKANGNRFLRQNYVKECWEEVDNEVAKEKVCHCFRSQAARRIRSSSSSSRKPSFSSNSSAPAAAGFPQTYTAAALSGGPIVQFPLHAMGQQENSHAATMAISPSTIIPLTQNMSVGSTATTSSSADQGPSTIAQLAMQYSHFLAPNNVLGASAGLPSTMNAGRLLLGGNINPFPSHGRPAHQPDEHAATMQPLFPPTYLDAASSAKVYWDHQTHMHSKNEGADDAR